MSVCKRQKLSNENNTSFSDNNSNNSNNFIDNPSTNFNNDNMTTTMVFNPKKGDMVILGNFDNIIYIKDIITYNKDITKSLITGYIVDLDGSRFSIKFEYKDIMQIIYVDKFIK
jgi:hypothetical protein